MPLSRDQYGKVQSPRVYIDFIQYAKAIGYVSAHLTENITLGTIDQTDVWNSDPSKPIQYFINTAGESCSFDVRFSHYGDSSAGVYNNRVFGHFLQGINYYGAFAHDFQTCNTAGAIDSFTIEAYGLNAVADGELTSHPSEASLLEIVGSNVTPGVGYTIVECGEWAGTDETYGDPDNETDRSQYEAIRLKLNNPIDSGVGWSPGESFWLGSLSVGRYMDFPVSPDLDVKISYDYDGIDSQTTIGGATISNINYYRAPDWGHFPRWLHNESTSINHTWYKEFDSKHTGQNGRRSWKLKFSYIDEKDTFPRWAEYSMAAEYHGSEETNLWSSPTFYDGDRHQESIVGTFLTFTLGGRIPFLFQPNKSVQEFAMCVLKEKSLKIEQVAHGTYSVSMTMTEVW